MNENRKCPVCNAMRLIQVREVPTVRTGRNIILYHCTHCHSFSNPSGYMEDETALKADLNWSIKAAERNKLWAQELFRNILLHKPTIKTVLEIGCGIGSALKVAIDEFDLSVVGYDVNEHAVNWGRQHYALNLHSELWRAGVSDHSDLTLCLSLLEHIEQPLPLIHDLCKHTKASRGLLFISVPFLDPHKWRFIDDPDPQLKGTPFFDNDVHITHFSRIGLITAIKNQGLSCRSFKAGNWWGILGDANPGLKKRINNFNWWWKFKIRQNLLRRKYLRPGKGSEILREVLLKDTV